MELYKVRDVVRENVGRDRMTRNMLDYAQAQALRRIEIDIGSTAYVVDKSKTMSWDGTKWK